MSQSTKSKLFSDIEKLPEQKLPELLDFVHYLIWQSGSTARPAEDPRPSLADDPILNFIGGVSFGSLAHDIDEELYGKAVAG